MCLYAKKLEVKRSTGEIQVYKILKKVSLGIYCTPFRRTLVGYGRRLISEDKIDIRFNEDYFEIHGGVIHGYTSLSTARKRLKEIALPDYVICKAIIPINRIYFKGSGGEIGVRELCCIEEV